MDKEGNSRFTKEMLQKKKPGTGTLPGSFMRSDIAQR